MSTPKTHDYTTRGWGHDYLLNTIHDGGKRIDAVGWGKGIIQGDFILMENKGSATRYRFKSIKYFSDPSDMWSAEIEFAPRKQSNLQPA